MAALLSSRELWASADPGDWSAALAAYPEALAALGKDKLIELDKWYCEDLPLKLAAMQRPALEQPELVRLVDWKLTRGKWRPRLLQFASEQQPEAVRQASQAAFDALRSSHEQQQPNSRHSAEVTGAAEAGAATRQPGDDDEQQQVASTSATAKAGGRGAGAGKGGKASGKKGSKAAVVAAAGQDGSSCSWLQRALEALTVLKGVGPATASGALAAACSDAPFMSDEAMAVALPPALQSDYSPKAYLQLATALQGKALQLRQATAEAGGEGEGEDAAAPAGPEQRQCEGAGPGPGAAAWQHAPWSAVLVERALWAAAVLHQRPAAGAAAAAPKGKGKKAPAAATAGAGPSSGSGASGKRQRKV